jgi:hypothetical protein
VSNKYTGGKEVIFAGISPRCSFCGGLLFPTTRLTLSLLPEVLRYEIQGNLIQPLNKSFKP